MVSWSTLWGFTILVWMRPQFEAARVEKRRRTQKDDKRGVAASAYPNQAREAGQNGSAVVRRRKGSESPSSEAELEGHDNRNRNGTASGASQRKNAEKPSEAEQEAPDESIAAVIQEYEYYWQSYPSEGSFPERLDWAFDLVTAFRGSGVYESLSNRPCFLVIRTERFDQPD